MKTMRIVLTLIALAGVAACYGGGVKMNVSNVDNSVDNSQSGGGGSNNPCASYTPPNSNQVVQGTFDGTNCVYGSNFVGKTNPVRVNLTIPFITGKHIFQDSLFVGQDVSSGAAPAGGTGPTLTVAAGNTLVFQDAADYVAINRGASIVAVGSPTAPITFTSFTDAITGTAGANDVQQWGGMIINGNGITNNCSDAERAGNQCHVAAEGGGETHYGGSNNAESSGTLSYVIVKHTGFEVAPGDELNGITFNAVGSGTVVNNIQTYSTYDDGIEFFGGAVNVNNFIALYVRDDSIDFSDGWVGTVQNALVIHWQTDGNRCIEGDNVGSARSDIGVPLNTAPLTVGTVRNMTCITSNTDVNTHGDSEGVLVRQGGKLILENSIIYSGYGTAVNGVTSNECYEIDDNDNFSRAFAAANDSFRTTNTVDACELLAQDNLPNGDTILSWLQGANPSANGANYSFNSGNVTINTPVNANVRVLQPNSFFTAATIVDASGTTVVANASGLGAVQGNDDWTNPWAFGLRSSNADQPLWFVP